MALSINVFGGAKVTANGSVLGYTVDGVEISFNFYYKPVFTDVYGPSVGFDQQYFLQDVDITCNLIYYDPSVLAGLLPGTLDSAGTLVVAQTTYFPIVITPGDGTGMSGYTFPRCIVDPNCVAKLGTVAATNNIKFKALPSQLTSSSAGAVIFT